MVSACAPGASAAAACIATGLEPLADGLLADPTQDPQAFAAAFVNTDKGVADTKAALEGARAILMERWGEDAALVGELRTWLGENGVIRARVAEGKETEGAKYRDYFEHAESLAKIPSHRQVACGTQPVARISGHGRASRGETFFAINAALGARVARTQGLFGQNHCLFCCPSRGSALDCRPL